MLRLLIQAMWLAAGLLLGALGHIALAHFQLRPSASLKTRACPFCATHTPAPHARPDPAKIDLDRAQRSVIARTLPV